MSKLQCFISLLYENDWHLNLVKSFSNTRRPINLIEILSTECFLLNGLSDTERNGKTNLINQRERGGRGHREQETERETERGGRQRTAS